MARRPSKVLAWRATGVTDTLDSTANGPGLMSSLANLVPDPATRNYFVPRPAAKQLAGVANYLGAFSVFIILGNIVYGMVSTGVYDTPFFYNLGTNVFSTPSGVTTNNQPLTQSLVGDWTPATIATVGAYILVTHPGFNGPGNGYIGWFNITNPAAPTWASGNMTINGFVGVPTSVDVFGGRAYYAVANALVASDVYLPLQRTNANQVLTIGDSNPITALAGLGLNNTTGGIIQCLMIFKGIEYIAQLTGDYTGIPSPWSLNTLNVATGTLAPNSVTPGPFGLAFVAPDGLRICDFNSNVSDPIGSNGDGISLPFQNTPNPSRIVAAYNMNTLRIAVRLQANSVQNTVEYWYNFTLRAWSGPHTQPTIYMAPWNNTFITSYVPNTYT